MVVLVAIEIETTNQGQDRAIGRVQRDERRLCLRQLGDRPDAFVILQKADDRAWTYPRRGRRLVGQGSGDKLEPWLANGSRLAVRAQYLHFPRACLRHDTGDQVFAVRVCLKYFFGDLVHLVGICWQINEGLWPPVAVTAVVIHDPAPQGRISRLLIAGSNSGVNLDSLGIGVVAVGVVDHLPGHFRNELGMCRGVPCFSANHKLFLHRLLELLNGERPGLEHPAQHILLALCGPLRIDHRVVCRWRLGQTGEHGCLGGRQLIHRLPEVDAGRRGKPVSPLAEIDLVDIKLQNLVLGQVCLDLVGQQDFIQLAGIGLFAGQEKLPRDLHGNRAGTLLVAGKGGDGSSRHADVVDAAVAVKPLVFGCENRSLDQVRNLFDFYNKPALDSKFTQQIAFLAINPQWNLRLIIGNCR